MDTETLLYIAQGVTLALLIWSEYLGLTPRHKSNAITDLLICLLGKQACTSPSETPEPVIVTQTF